jgi:hypothetical protein
MPIDKPKRLIRLVALFSRDSAVRFSNGFEHKNVIADFGMPDFMICACLKFNPFFTFQ